MAFGAYIEYIPWFMHMVCIACFVVVFTPGPFRPKGFCRCLRLSVREFCYYIQRIYFTIWKKGKEELLPLQYHIKSLHIISRHYKKSLLRSPIYLGYEELSTDTSYPIWRRQKEERRSKYAMQLASWQLRSNSPKTSVCPSVRPSVNFTLSAW